MRIIEYIFTGAAVTLAVIYSAVVLALSLGAIVAVLFFHEPGHVERPSTPSQEGYLYDE